MLRTALARRVTSLRQRILALGGLRRTVGLPAGRDLAEDQWRVLETGLAGASQRLLGRLERAAEFDLARAHDVRAARRLNARLGALEMELAQAFVFFDTYVDAVTQRHSPVLGALLRGCDILAADALVRAHSALEDLQRPLVLCDRGFGAAILRQRVPLPGGATNPIPLIQIPYARLEEPWNLTSILHEAGHQALSRLALVAPMALAMRRSLERAGAGATLAQLFGSWSREIGPDFWGFCCSGLAQAATLREIMALPPEATFAVQYMDPHPPGWLRTLAAFDWCRRAWGRGPWDAWEREWLALYPLDSAPAGVRDLLAEGRRLLPVVSDLLLSRRWDALGGRALADLFDLDALAPRELMRAATAPEALVEGGSPLPPSAQLAAFRVAYERRGTGTPLLDRWMTRWLVRLGQQPAATCRHFDRSPAHASRQRC